MLGSDKERDFFMLSINIYPSLIQRNAWKVSQTTQSKQINHQPS